MWMQGPAEERKTEDERGVGGDESFSESLSKVCRIRWLRRILRQCIPSCALSSTSGVVKCRHYTMQDVFSTYKCHSIQRGIEHPGDIAEASGLRLGRILSDSAWQSLCASPQRLCMLVNVSLHCTGRPNVGKRSTS